MTTHLLDTNAWLRRSRGPDQIHPRARRVLEAPDRAPLAVSAISVWEIALKFHKRKLDLDSSLEKWLERALLPEFIKVIPIDAAVPRLATELPAGFHNDPADRFIVATAIHHGLTVVTSDERILSYAHVRSLDTR